LQYQFYLFRRRAIILADQLLAIAGPWAAGSLAAACPPDGVVQELEKKEAEIKK
jgi:hypothetical protein